MAIVDRAPHADSVPPSRGSESGPGPEFEISNAPAGTKGFPWQTLAEDPANDASRADGKALSYYFDVEADVLWVKFA